MVQRNLKHLIDLISENDDQLAFSELYKYYYPGLLSFAHSILKNKENAEEVILDVFISLWENRKTLQTIKKLPNYLYVATKHGAIRHLRKKNIINFDELQDDFEYTLVSPEQIFITKENITSINSIINTLPPKCRLIFRLVKEERLSYEEVATLLELSKKTVEAQLYIAYKRLIQEIKRTLPEYKNNLAFKNKV